MNVTDQIPLRARFEHYKSTDNLKKLYVSLGYVALPEGIFIQYYAEYDESSTWLRPVEEFAGLTQSGNKRFTLIEEDAITTERRDEIISSSEELFA